jgi:aminobenzoyl-glutamate transport protein
MDRGPLTTTSATAPGKGARILRWIERIGNALPHPATLFLILALLVIVASDIAVRAGVEVVKPGTDEIVRPVSLLTIHGLHRILTSLVTNFTSFAPLGTALVALLGIGIAESSGLIGTSLRLFVIKAPRRMLTIVIVFTGVLSNMASEIGYVLLVPLAALIFIAAGRHPIAGMAAAFAGVSGGYSANLFLGTIDPLLSGLTQEAAQIVTPGYLVNPACNYYFMAASTFFITAAGWLVTDKIVEPRLGPWKDDQGTKGGAGAQVTDGSTVPPAGKDAVGDGAEAALRPLDASERRGLSFALVAAILFTALIVWGTVPADGFLRDPKTGGLLHSPFLSGIVDLIFAGGALLGIANGIGARTIR